MQLEAMMGGLISAQLKGNFLLSGHMTVSHVDTFCNWRHGCMSEQSQY